jgi:YD repeat-containing protein
VISTTNPNGKVTTMTYTAAGDLASVTDPLGNETTYTYDALGRQLTRVSPRGNAAGAIPADFTTTPPSRCRAVPCYACHPRVTDGRGAATVPLCLAVLQCSPDRLRQVGAPLATRPSLIRLVLEDPVSTWRDVESELVQDARGVSARKPDPLPPFELPLRRERCSGHLYPEIV